LPASECGVLGEHTGRAGPSGAVQFLACWPSHRAVQRARDRVREITARERLLVPIEEIVEDLNRYLRGWSGYFRDGNSARQFNLIQVHAHDRLALFVTKRHQRVARLRLAGRHTRLAEPHGPDQPLGNCRRT
jgi:Group II intron, maturase-specific domain